MGIVESPGPGVVRVGYGHRYGFVSYRGVVAGGSFVGRSDELARLDAELTLAAGGRARAVVVSGEPGVGKTRLCEEFGRRCRHRARSLVGRGSPLAATLAFSAVAEAIESHLRSLAPEAVTALCRGSVSVLAPLLPTVAARFADRDRPVASPLDTLAALGDLLAAMASDQPLVLVVDDVHRADSSTLDLLGYLIRNPLAARVVIVLGCRTEELLGRPDLAESIGALIKDGLASEIRLGPLPEADLATLAERTVGPDVATPELVEWLCDRSRGNPLYASALLEELCVDPTRRAVPASVRDRVRAIISSLPTDGRAVLEAAAVLGSSFEPAALEGLLQPGAAGWLDELSRRGLLTEPNPAGRPSYDFSHPVVQEAVYEGMGAMRRRDLHRRAVEALRDEPAAVRAYHASRGAALGDEAAVDTILEAARDAEARQLHRQAVELLTAALDLVPAKSPRRRQVLDELAWQAGCVGDHLSGVPALRELESLVADDPEARAAAKMRLASLLAWGEGNLGAAEVEAAEAVDLFRQAGLDRRVAAATNELAWIVGARRSVAGQIAGAREALAAADDDADAEVVLHALGTLGHGLMLSGEVDEGLATMRRGLHLAQQRRDMAQLEWFTAVLVEGLLSVGRITEAVAAVQQFEAEGVAPVDLLPSRRAILNWFQGNWRAAQRCCREAQALSPGPPPVHSAWVLGLRGLLETVTGTPAAAATFLAQGDRVYGGRHVYWMSARHDWAVGMTNWLNGDLVSGVARLAAAASQAHVIGAPLIEAEILPDLIEARIAGGELSEAETGAQRLEAIVATQHCAFLEGRAAYGRALVLEAAGKHTEAVNGFDLAAGSAAAVGASFFEAQALEHQGGCETGTAAVALLTAAARAYAALPAPAHEARVRSALRDRGPTGRRSARTVGNLTRREHEVLALARTRLTAKEIAVRLHVNERTVETHLAHIYRKLAVSGRHELMSVTPDNQP